MIPDDALSLEQALLANLISYPRAYFSLLGKYPNFSQVHFSSQLHRDIFSSIQKIANPEAEQKIEINVITVFFNLPPSATVSRSYLSELSDHSSPNSNTHIYASKLIDLYSKKQLGQLSQEIYKEVEKDSKSVEQISETIISKVSAFTPPPICAADSSLTAHRYLNEIEAIKKEQEENGLGLVGFSTGIPSLDQYTRGFRKSSLITIASSTGYGKTFCCLNIATHLALQGKKILYFSLEMPDIELIPRILPMLKQPFDNLSNTDIIEAHTLQGHKQETFHQLIEKYKSLDFTINWGTKSINKILLACEQKRRDTGLDLIVIDHLQLLQGSHDYANLCHYTSSFKNYALANNVPILLVSQLNRASAARENKEPMASDLRGSGSIEQDSDAILFLYRPDPKLPDATLILNKFRQATTFNKFRCPIKFDSNFNRFVEVDMHENLPENPYEQMQQQNQNKFKQKSIPF